MRIKFLSVIVSFLVVSIAVSSCLNSDDTYEYSSDATVHAFGLDTIHGRHYKFSIDQLSRLIYNKDSLPVGSDTIIDRILIDTFSTVSGIITSGATDTLFLTTDSIDLTPAMNNDAGMKFKVHAPDGITVREYTLKINVHLQDPDSLTWGEMSPFSTTPVPAVLKAVTLKSGADETLWIYTSHTTAYRTSTDPSSIRWESVSGINLPADIQLASIVNFKSTPESVNSATEKQTLFAVTNSNKVYQSENGVAWQEVTALGHNVKAVIATQPNILTGIVEVDGGYYFNTSKDGQHWDKAEKDENGDITLIQVPDDFPIENIYTSQFTTANGIAQAMAVGTPRVTGNEQTLIWFSIDGDNWAEMSSVSYNAYCPAMNNPFAMYYGGLFYCFGDQFNAIYSSETGISWRQTEEKFLLPEALTENTAPYSIVVDENNFIWIISGGQHRENKVWRGRLNRLGFKEQ